ncbi:hypothetical protein [Clostridium sp.]|uniref:hypothetical protein n=1 Tax=Clostridium sp. TaxID=1506 RepID=UPI0029132A22|nr:hypothetical protein [Clostridium sp.]MDU3410010.1 hypothetical protein [Clostridium sp.]
MSKFENYFPLFIAFLGALYLVIVVIKEKRKTDKMKNTPIDVYRYMYNIYLNDGSFYEKLANVYVIYSFDTFVKTDILWKDTLKYNDFLSINTKNITKVECIKIIHNRVKPILSDFGVDKVYTEEEVLERKVK